MGISLSDLSPAARDQAVRKLAAQLAAHRRDSGPTPPVAAEKPEKYHNTPTEAGGIRFDSKKEARRFQELRLRAVAGEIRELRLQVDFTLQEGYTTAAGQRVRAIRYRADFVYEEQKQVFRMGEDSSFSQGVEWALVVEDVKSKATRTKEYLIKRKMMEDRLKLSIREV